MEQFIANILKRNPNYNGELLQRAYEQAEKLHKDQKRRSGEPYIIHPVAVVKILADLGMDDNTLVAGMLHDTLEDTKYKYDELAADFSEEVAMLVDGVTKLTNINYTSKKEAQAENTRKLFLAMSKDIRVLVIKLADRLHNLRTINYMTPEKTKEKCTETIEIYAPLAARLGIYAFKFEMEDICFRNLYPEDYAKLDEQMHAIQTERDENIDRVIDIINDILSDSGITYTIYGRNKHYYSIYKKMMFQHKELDEIFDLKAIRIIVDSVRDCYAVLGTVHTRWKPIPGRFKDYIAMPKPNGYQSLHTTVLSDGGTPFEIQIRTVEMHHIAEYGVAAHWKYKEGVAKDDEEVRLAWIRQTLEWQQESNDSQDFLDTVKTDLFTNQVFVFTPKGDVMELPAGSTPLDFAYKIHSKVGDKCVGAKVNGKMVTIDYKLCNGEIVDIVTSNNSKGPSIDWLKIVKTNSARNKIRQFLKHQEKLEHPEAEEKPKEIEKPIEIIDPEAEFEKKLAANRKRLTHTRGISVMGVDDLMIHFAHCCNPVPGDAIIGYTTKGSGISVHRADCSNILKLPEKDKVRLIEVDWQLPENQNMYFDASLTILADDKKGLLAAISKVCEDMDINITGLISKADADGKASIVITLAISNILDVSKIMSKFKQINGVYEVYRTNS